MQSPQRLSLKKEIFRKAIAISLLCPAGNFNKSLDLRQFFFLTFNVFLGIRILCYHKALFGEKIDADELLSRL